MRYLLGHFFVGKTDHKPLVGLLKKIDSIKNQRLIAMALATTEFSFEVEYLPGKRNILVDYGTRHISDTDWPVDVQDPLEPDSLFPFIQRINNRFFPSHRKNIYTVQLTLKNSID